MAVEERTVSAWHGAVKTHVRVAGSGSPVVYLHGAGGPAWDPFLDALAEKHTVYAPDFPGTTPGDPDAIKAIDTLWDLVLYEDELLDALGLEQAAVVGHSFGGMVAAEIAANMPKRVSKLVLIAPAGLWRDDNPVPMWTAIPAAELPARAFADPQSAAAQAMFAPPDDPEAALDQVIQANWAAACAGKFWWPIPDKGLKKRIHRVTAPTLVIWGEKDGLIPPAYAKEFAAKIPGTRVQLVADAGHLPQVEQRELVTKAVLEFLAR